MRSAWQHLRRVLQRQVHSSRIASLYLSATTLGTIGLGDLHPVTVWLNSPSYLPRSRNRPQIRSLKFLTRRRVEQIAATAREANGSAEASGLSPLRGSVGAAQASPRRGLVSPRRETPVHDAKERPSNASPFHARQQPGVAGPDDFYCPRTGVAISRTGRPLFLTSSTASRRNRSGYGGVERRSVWARAAMLVLFLVVMAFVALAGFWRF